MSSEIRASDTSDVMPTNECDHMTGVMFWTNGARFAYASERLGNKPWTYCPKCGEKL